MSTKKQTTKAKSLPSGDSATYTTSITKNK